MSETRICSKCKQEKPETEFRVDRSRKYGRRPACKACESPMLAKNSKNYHDKNREALNENRRKKRAETPIDLRYSEQDKLRRKRYYAQNKDALLEKQKIRWQAMSPEKKKVQLEKQSGSSESIRRAKRKYKLKRKVDLGKATVSWSIKFFVEEIYNLCDLRNKVTDIRWAVDHVVPLCSNLVCGLHCEDNLAIISSVENSRKSNRWWPDMPNYTAQDLHELRYYKWLAENT